MSLVGTASFLVQAASTSGGAHVEGWLSRTAVRRGFCRAPLFAGLHPLGSQDSDCARTSEIVHEFFRVIDGLGAGADTGGEHDVGLNFRMAVNLLTQRRRW
jgi:hypothetical protein